ncbi:Zf-BED domain-containing protein [Quillaja saponaria]|uniref:Zf-BED domain-containing protein n=1 Tax=Quillaja saponaria TaxID=32244 RepID=A0AAD7M412_QUISA|nr:Zf-BED domain-containing protein [Quillaja saponaria]
MNDLVFVMYNCKLNERQTKKYSGPSLKLNDLSSNDEWITPKEDLADSSLNEWLSVLDDSSNANDDVIDADAPLDEDEVQVVKVVQDEDVEDDVGVVGGEVDEIKSVDSDEGENPIDNEDGNDDNDNSDDDVSNGDDDGESGGDDEDNCDVYEEGTNFGLD